MLGEFLSGLGHFHLDGANFQMQTHIVPKIMHQKAVFLRQLHYGQIGFIVSFPGLRWGYKIKEWKIRERENDDIQVYRGTPSFPY